MKIEFIEMVEDYKGIKEGIMLSPSSQDIENGYLCELAGEHDTYFEHIPLDVARQISRKYWEKIDYAKRVLAYGKQSRLNYRIHKTNKKMRELFDFNFKSKKGSE